MHRLPMPAEGDVAAPPVTDPVRQLALAYVPAHLRAPLQTLWALDECFADAVRGRDAMAARFRLAWWGEAIEALGAEPAAANAPPLLIAIERLLVARGTAPARLSALIDGWEILLDPDPLTRASMSEYARARGAIFEIAGELLSGEIEALASAGQGWALGDLAGHVSDVTLAASARAAAIPFLDAALRERWPRELRALGIIASVTRGDLTGQPRWRKLAGVLRLGILGR